MKINENLEKHYNDTIETYLKIKEQNEKEIEKYLEEEPVDLREVEYHISLLTQAIRMIEHYKLLLEGKDIDALNLLINMEHFITVKNELLKKYNIEQEIQEFHKQEKRKTDERNNEERIRIFPYEISKVRKEIKKKLSFTNHEFNILLKKIYSFDSFTDREKEALLLTKKFDNFSRENFLVKTKEGWMRVPNIQCEKKPTVACILCILFIGGFITLCAFIFWFLISGTGTLG